MVRARTETSMSSRLPMPDSWDASVRLVLPSLSAAPAREEGGRKEAAGIASAKVLFGEKNKEPRLSGARWTARKDASRSAKRRADARRRGECASKRADERDS